MDSGFSAPVRYAFILIGCLALCIAVGACLPAFSTQSTFTTPSDSSSLIYTSSDCPLPIGDSGKWFDVYGNFYLADSHNEIVRQVAQSSCSLSISAGYYTSSVQFGGGKYYGDGGAALSAKLNVPAGVAVDSAGNVYVADSGNHVVRKVSASTGVITTYAGDGNIGYSGDGGLATAASLNTPYGLALDSSGNLYVSDPGASVIRVVSASTGVITTYAGSGTAGYSVDGGSATAAELGTPLGVAIDSSGNLFFADNGNELVRKVTSAGVISTVAGTAATAGYSGDGGLATAAELDSPYGVAVDSSDNVYIADSGNQVIRLVTNSTGFISTVAGTAGVGGYSGNAGQATSAEIQNPTAVLLDDSGNLYISQIHSSAIRKVTLSSGVITTVAGSGTDGYSGDGGAANVGQIESPIGIALDSSGNLYIGDSGNNLVRKVSAGTGDIATYAGLRNGFGGDGGPAFEADLLSPSDLAFDSSGDLYIADPGSATIRRVDVTTGVVTTVAGGADVNDAGSEHGDGGAATSAYLYDPAYLVLDTAGDIFVTTVYDYTIREISAATGLISTVAGTQGSLGYTGNGGLATSATLNYPAQAAFDSSGNLYIADSGNSVVRKVSTAGIITTFAGNGTSGYSGDGEAAVDAELGQPMGVAVDASGNVWIADAAYNVIREVSASTGYISTFAGTGTAGYSGDGGEPLFAELNHPDRLSFDAYGILYVYDIGNQAIREIDVSDDIITTLAGTGAAGYNGDGGLSYESELFLYKSN
jgi:sugar lactone lactonase YvrE